MSITTRGAVAPTGHRPDQDQGASALPAPPQFDPVALSETVAFVADHAPGWAKTDATARADLLSRVIADTLAAQDDWLAAACAAKGLDPDSTEAGEELFTGLGTFVRMARLFRESLHAIAKNGKPDIPGPIRHTADGRLRVQVLPANTFDKVTFAQTSAEVIMAPGVTRSSLVAGQAAAYADPEGHAGTALVLAAGNVASLGPRDALSKLFVEGKVVVMKANPVNDYLVPHWNRALGALVEAGVLRIVDGGAAVGQYLTRHPLIDRGAHHRLGQDVRRRRLRQRTRRGPAQGGRRARPRQAGERRAGQRIARHRRAGKMVDGRSALPGRARGHHAGEQRRLQLRLGPPRRDARRLAPSARLSSAR